MNEAGRRCDRCGFGWYATPPGANPGKPRWFDETGAFWTDGQARMARRTANYDRHLTAKDAWEKCPNCGSRSIKTDRSRGFTPTGAVAPTRHAAHQPSEPTRPVEQQSPAAGHAIMRRVAAFHGKHWRLIWAVVFFLGPFGSLSDPDMRTGSTVSTVAAIVAVFAVSWAVAFVFLRLHQNHVNTAR